MDNNLTLYKEKYYLKDYELLFMTNFEDTHSLSKSLDLLTKYQKGKVNASLRGGKNDLAKCFKDFVSEAPIHPEANKVVILDNLVWVMNQSKQDLDTQGVIRAISEINKMIKGNLVSTKETKIIEKQFVGLIDLTNKNNNNNNDEEERVTIDIT